MSQATKAIIYQNENNLCCASTIAAGEKGLNDPFVQECKKFCGGKAPGGLCGTAYVCSRVLVDMEDLVMATLMNFAGAIPCKEIKEKGYVSCKSIVFLMSELLEKH